MERTTEAAVGGEGPGQGRGTEAVEIAVQHETVGVPAAAKGQERTIITTAQRALIAGKKTLAVDRHAFRAWEKGATAKPTPLTGVASKPSIPMGQASGRRLMTTPANSSSSSSFWVTASAAAAAPAMLTIATSDTSALIARTIAGEREALASTSTAEQFLIHSDTDPDDEHDAPSCDADPVISDGLNLGDEWEQSFLDHQLRRRECTLADACPPVAISSVPSHQPDLSSDHLQDLLELEEFSAVSWPDGLDARIARIILRDRRG